MIAGLGLVVVKLFLKVPLPVTVLAGSAVGAVLAPTLTVVAGVAASAAFVVGLCLYCRRMGRRVPWPPADARASVGPPRAERVRPRKALPRGPVLELPSAEPVRWSDLQGKQPANAE